MTSQVLLLLLHVVQLLCRQNGPGSRLHQGQKTRPGKERLTFTGTQSLISVGQEENVAVPLLDVNFLQETNTNMHQVNRKTDFIVLNDPVQTN